MSFTTVLVSLNEVDRIPVLLRLATEIAASEDAHVIGLYVVPAPRLYPVMEPGLGTQVLDEFPEFVRSRSESVRREFESTMEKQAIASEWRLVEGRSPDVSDTVIQHALQTDLVVVSQPKPESTSGIAADFAERVVMECGRPVLLVPAWGNFTSLGRRVLIGWKARREAARAVFDAVPLLARAEAVHIAMVDSASSLGEAEVLPETELATALARHGAKVTSERLTTSVDAGNALLSRASDIGADLLVMGAYGHSRMREFVFGGVTRTVLQTMTVPVLMSH